MSLGPTQYVVATDNGAKISSDDRAMAAILFSECRKIDVPAEFYFEVICYDGECVRLRLDDRNDSDSLETC